VGELAGVAMLLFVGVALFVRFLVIGARKRDPATLLTSLATLVGTIGASLMVLAARTVSSDPELSNRLATGAVACATVCVSVNIVLTGIVFRRSNGIGWLMSALLLAAMWATVVGTALSGDVDLRRIPTGWRLGNSILLLGGLFWGSIDTAITWRFLRRQAAQGLASEAVARRIGLWSIASGAAAVGGVIGFATMSFGIRVAESGAGLALAPLGLLAAWALWRSFGTAERLDAAISPQSGSSAKS
jgi:hypothetical protein